MPDSEGDGTPLSWFWRQEQLHAAFCLNVIEVADTGGPEMVAFCIVFYSEPRCTASSNSRVKSVGIDRTEPHRLGMPLRDVYGLNALDDSSM